MTTRKYHKCPECDYRAISFASVAMHFMRLHHRIGNGDSPDVPSPRLQAKYRMLQARFLRYRQEHP